MNGQEYARCRLPDLHTETLHVFRQPWQCVLNAVLRHHLCHVQVGADAEGNGYCKPAVAGRLTAHVEPVLDAIDLLLERRRHGARYRVRGCSRIHRRDLHSRWDDLRVLRDRQDCERTEPEERHESAQHGRETGAFDKEMSQAHFLRSLLVLTTGITDRSVLSRYFGSAPCVQYPL